jgi:L-idonate 5-dehydrogenase
LDAALTMGADIVLSVGEEPQALADWIGRNKRFDVHFEASGSPVAALDGIAALSSKGICVLIGQGAEVPLQVSNLIRQEVDMRGSFRFDGEFQIAVDCLGTGRLNVGHIITATLPVAEGLAAFDLALDKTKSVKVQLEFS